MNITKKKIIIATGGTGGHVFPALSLSETLEKKFEIEIFSDSRGLKYFKNKKNIREINSDTIFHKNLFKTLLSFKKIIFSIISSFFYLKKIRPEMVFGMGGYSSFPVCVASYLLNIPIIIYENNLVIGRANKFLLPFVKKILIANKFVKGISPKYKEKIYFTGYFLRSNIFQIEKKMYICTSRLGLLCNNIYTKRREKLRIIYT